MKLFRIFLYQKQGFRKCEKSLIIWEVVKCTRNIGRIISISRSTLKMQFHISTSILFNFYIIKQICVRFLESAISVSVKKKVKKSTKNNTIFNLLQVRASYYLHVRRSTYYMLNFLLNLTPCMLETVTKMSLQVTIFRLRWLEFLARVGSEFMTKNAPPHCHVLSY